MASLLPSHELKFVVSVNIPRRRPDEFQRAEVAIKFDKLFRKIAREKFRESHFTSETAREAGIKSGISRRQEEIDEADNNERLASGEANRSFGKVRFVLLVG